MAQGLWICRDFNSHPPLVAFQFFSIYFIIILTLFALFAVQWNLIPCVGIHAGNWMDWRYERRIENMEEEEAAHFFIESEINAHDYWVARKAINFDCLNFFISKIANYFQSSQQLAVPKCQIQSNSLSKVIHSSIFIWTSREAKSTSFIFSPLPFLIKFMHSWHVRFHLNTSIRIYAREIPI